MYLMIHVYEYESKNLLKTIETPYSVCKNKEFVSAKTINSLVNEVSIKNKKEVFFKLEDYEK